MAEENQRAHHEASRAGVGLRRHPARTRGAAYVDQCDEALPVDSQLLEKLRRPNWPPFFLIQINAEPIRSLLAIFVPRALFWFALFQRKRTRSPSLGWGFCLPVLGSKFVSTRQFRMSPVF